MRHILGVASPCLSVRDPCVTVLELDFLRLSYAVAHLNSKGEDTHGYIAVLRQEIRDAVLGLKRRYGVGEEVRIVFASLLVADMTRLAEAAGPSNADGVSETEASVAHDIALNALRCEIAAREPGAVEKTATGALPFGVEWDYYGVEW
jgi:hypothetical protein